MKGKNAPVVEATTLVKTFTPKNARTVTALTGIDFSVSAGELTALVGPDGAGKTTLLRLIAGLLDKTAGNLRVLGHDVAKEPQKVQSRLSYMPQKFGLYEDLTVEENMQLYADLHGIEQEERHTRFPRLLHMTGLAPFTGRLAGNLSGGMKQKLGLLCTLVRSPDLLLLDEPTAGVDPLSRRELWEILQEQAREAGLSVLCATAYMSEAALCQKVILLDRGRILAAGTPDEVRRPLHSIFGTSPTSAAQAQLEDAASGEKRSAIIEVRDLVKKFGDFTAVNNTSFQVYKGEVFGLLGPNGAGKTTTFRMLCGLLPATSGKLRVAGVDLARARTEARAQIGYVAQKFSLYQNLTALENLRFFGGIYGLRPKALAARIEAVLAEFDLKERKNDRAGDLPGGYKQRLAMAAALLHEPPLLFLDEPTSGIDPRARRLFWQKIDALSKRGTTVIITTHFMEEAEYCTRILIQDHGTMLVLGSPAEIRARMKMPAADMNDVFIRIVEEARRREEAIR